MVETRIMHEPAEGECLHYPRSRPLLTRLSWNLVSLQPASAAVIHELSLTGDGGPANRSGTPRKQGLLLARAEPSKLFSIQ